MPKKKPLVLKSTLNFKQIIDYLLTSKPFIKDFFLCI